MTPNKNKTIEQEKLVSTIKGAIYDVIVAIFSKSYIIYISTY